ncbi:MAG: nucleotidyltransferase family protein [Elusimicrobia bacterium]|nr:nucleotidyltransferase family protein [Elusimicrobiota bacterium]
MLDVGYIIGTLNLSKKEEYLLKLYTSKTVTKDEIYRLLNDFDYSIENEELAFNFLLAHLFQNNPHIEIPKDIEPRLKGVLRMFQYKNVLLLSALKQLVSKLNEQNIPVLLLKGSVMRIIEQDKLRLMSDVDCAVDMDNFDKTIKISESLGFKINIVFEYATEVKRNPMQKIDIHKKFIKGDNDTSCTEKKIFERAEQYNFGNSDVFIPNTEDMIFLLLNNGYDNIIYSQPFYKNVSWLFDVIYIIKNNKSIDWNIVISNAKESKTIAQIKIMLELVNHFSPNTIPNEILSSINISKQEYDINDSYTKKHLFFHKAQQLKCQARELIIGKKISDIFSIINLLSQFLYIKIIQKTPIIKSLFFNKVANRMFKI